jgi:hypothetical protein
LNEDGAGLRDPEQTCDNRAAENRGCQAGHDNTESGSLASVFDMNDASIFQRQDVSSLGSQSPIAFERKAREVR